MGRVGRRPTSMRSRLGNGVCLPVADADLDRVVGITGIPMEPTL